MQDASFVIRTKLFTISSFHALQLNMCGAVLLSQLVPRIGLGIFPSSSGGVDVIFQPVEMFKSLV
jgi:hypothetical protein